MGDGTHAGLQSASAVAKQFEKRKREEAELGRENLVEGEEGGEETVYRDATGRRIDISMRRQEARKEMDEKLKKEREEKELQKAKYNSPKKSASRGVGRGAIHACGEESGR